MISYSFYQPSLYFSTIQTPGEYIRNITSFGFGAFLERGEKLQKAAGCFKIQKRGQNSFLLYVIVGFKFPAPGTFFFHKKIKKKLTEINYNIIIDIVKCLTKNNGLLSFFMCFFLE
jgi:hypothetical protein